METVCHAADAPVAITAKMGMRTASWVGEKILYPLRGVLRKPSMRPVELSPGAPIRTNAAGHYVMNIAESECYAKRLPTAPGLQSTASTSPGPLFPGIHFAGPSTSRSAS